MTSLCYLSRLVTEQVRGWLCRQSSHDVSPISPRQHCIYSKYMIRETFGSGNILISQVPNCLNLTLLLFLFSRRSVLQCVCTLQRLIDRCVRSKLLHAVESIIIVFIIYFFYNRPKHCKGGTGDLKVQRVTLCFENNSQMLVCILKHLFRFLPNVRHM